MIQHYIIQANRRLGYIFIGEVDLSDDAIAPSGLRYKVTRVLFSAGEIPARVGRSSYPVTDRSAIYTGPVQRLAIKAVFRWRA